MSEHPHRETLEGFLLNSLPKREAKAMVAHLLVGCDHCRQEMSPLATAMFTPGAGPEPQLSIEEDAAYDRSIAAAFAKALELDKSLATERETAARRSEDFVHAVEQAEETSSHVEGDSSSYHQRFEPLSPAAKAGPQREANQMPGLLREANAGPATRASCNVNLRRCSWRHSWSLSNGLRDSQDDC